MDFLIVTGLSGAGKSKTLEFLEDIGYYCIDNMPPALILNFAELFQNPGGKFVKAAIVTDVRGGSLFSELEGTLKKIRDAGLSCKILFLDASDEALIKRYKETRRKHPLSKEGSSLPADILKEKAMLSEIKKQADYIIDTSSLTPKQLSEHLRRIFIDKMDFNKGLVVNVLSFGFKFGIPIESDLVFDVRFLPNPFYIDELKSKTGLNEEVFDYVFKWPQTHKFEKMLSDMLIFLLPQYITEGKSSLVISIGCTGGKHRSVAIAHRLHKILREKNYYVVTNHRDIDK